jgi:hypothetical protein
VRIPLSISLKPVQKNFLTGNQLLPVSAQRSLCCRKAYGFSTIYDIRVKDVKQINTEPDEVFMLCRL